MYVKLYLKIRSCSAMLVPNLSHFDSDSLTKKIAWCIKYIQFGAGCQRQSEGPKWMAQHFLSFSMLLSRHLRFIKRQVTFR